MHVCVNVDCHNVTQDVASFCQGRGGREELLLGSRGRLDVWLGRGERRNWKWIVLTGVGFREVRIELRKQCPIQASSLQAGEIQWEVKRRGNGRLLLMKEGDFGRK
mmetsp:Transcript_3974/g.6967  ORF Transcript_3974/g.6967 Transcript_3974/m.6967 type:complete len:106 (+) Transcript_3974:1940-2257(+)